MPPFPLPCNGLHVASTQWKAGLHPHVALMLLLGKPKSMDAPNILWRPIQLLANHSSVGIHFALPRAPYLFSVLSC